MMLGRSSKKRVVPVYFPQAPEIPSKVARIEPMENNLMTFTAADGAFGFPLEAFYPKPQDFLVKMTTSPYTFVPDAPDPMQNFFNLVPSAATLDQRPKSLQSLAGTASLGSEALPEDLPSLVKLLDHKVQHSYGQLDSLLGAAWKQPGCACAYCSDSLFASIGLPKCRKKFQNVCGKKRKYLIPEFILVNGVTYDFDTEKKIKFGGYGAVAFFNKSSLHASVAQGMLPQRIALKVGAVKRSELENILSAKFNPAQSKSHWMREFCVYRRLRRSQASHETNPYNHASGFVNFYGGVVAKVGRSFFAYNVLEAGKCDLFELFTTQPLAKNTPERQLALVRVLQTAAESLEQLHQFHLHHGDVKLANMLLEPTHQSALFMDFDGAVFFDEETSCDTYTREYVSPQRREKSKNYSKAADDNWALGISFLIALTLKKSPIEDMPLSVVKDFDMRRHLQLFLLEIAMPESVKQALITVICGLLMPYEVERMTAGTASSILRSALHPLLIY